MRVGVVGEYQWRSQDLILGGAVKNNVRGERSDGARASGASEWEGGVPFFLAFLFGGPPPPPPATRLESTMSL